MTINELIEKAHATAKEKGFWDQERNTGELLMLIVSECGEALEAHRKSRRADLAKYDTELKPTLAMLNGGQVEFRAQAESAIFKETFRAYIKDTFEDELADIVIRIADYLGHQQYVVMQAETKVSGRAPMNVGDALFRLVKVLALEMNVTMEWAIHGVFAIAEDHGIDLWLHIELKMAYNATRPRLHGKAY